MENPKPKIYDLEDRTFKFAQSVRRYISNLPKNTNTIEDGKQVIRSSGSIGANYIEANDSFSSKDRILRLKISKKEARETVYWLKLLNAPEELIQEARELSLILATIIDKVSAKK